MHDRYHTQAESQFSPLIHSLNPSAGVESSEGVETSAGCSVLVVSTVTQATLGDSLNVESHAILCSLQISVNKVIG